MYIMVRIKNIAKHIRLNKKENVTKYGRNPIRTLKKQSHWCILASYETPLGNTFVLAPFPNSFVIVRIC